MAYAIRCKTCGKISKRNYVSKPKVESKKEFTDCIKNNHSTKVEKVY